MNRNDLNRIYSDEELDVMLNGMRAASLDFYIHATRIGNQAFIEFCGLMNEYIKMCQKTRDEGRDFTTCNIHSGQSLTCETYHAKYLAEKFGCIYGTILADEEKRQAFTDCMGWK